MACCNSIPVHTPDVLSCLQDPQALACESAPGSRGLGQRAQRLRAQRAALLLELRQTAQPQAAQPQAAQPPPVALRGLTATLMQTEASVACRQLQFPALGCC